MNVPLHYQPDATPDSLTQPRLSHTEQRHPSVQQVYVPYGISDTSTLVHQTQYQAGQAAALRFHMQQPFSLSTAPPSQTQHKGHSLRWLRRGCIRACVCSCCFVRDNCGSSVVYGPTRSRKREAPLSARLTGSRKFTKPAS